MHIDDFAPNLLFYFFNGIRTTLHALIAIYDNCNSLHTNAYDEAIATPTDESVRRALTIQLIIKTAALQQAVIDDENVFVRLMEAARVCLLGQITEALFAVGGQCRRSM